MEGGDIVDLTGLSDESDAETEGTMTCVREDRKRKQCSETTKTKSIQRDIFSASDIKRQKTASDSAAPPDSGSRTDSSSTTDVSPTAPSSPFDCPRKHGLQCFFTPFTFTCDMCGKNIGMSVIMFGCRKCNYDLCRSCWKPEIPQSTASASQLDSSSIECPSMRKSRDMFMKKRERAVSACTFDLSKTVDSKVTISTGRSIKNLGANWNTHWPVIREFMQNTIDHVNLLDCKTGKLHEALVLKFEQDANKSVFRFVVPRGDDERTICKISVEPDSIFVEQWFTFPLSTRTLDTGVSDTSKNSAHTAGGFGDGFKTAAASLLSQKGFGSLKWHFFAKGQRIDWNFRGRHRERVGTIAASSVLVVDVTQVAVDTSTRENLMEQEICAKGIGTSFLRKALSRFAIFWTLDESKILRSSRTSNFVALSSEHSLIGQCGSPSPGVYVQGIWVQRPKIKNSIMSFFGRTLRVCGRDRNNVDEDDVCVQTLRILQELPKSTKRGRLRQLLMPLITKENSNWLVYSKTFLHRMIEQNKKFFLHDVFGFDRLSLFVYANGESKDDPFIKWASGYLKSNGKAYLQPIKRRLDRKLFEEVDAFTLKERCVSLLLAEARLLKKSKSGCAILSQKFRKFLQFLGHHKSTRVLFLPSVSVPFVYRSMTVFATEPVDGLTSEYCTDLICAINAEMHGNQKRSSALIVSLARATYARKHALTDANIDEIISRAEERLKQQEKFFSGANDVKKPGYLTPPASPPRVDMTTLLATTSATTNARDPLEDQLLSSARRTASSKRRSIIPSSAFAKDNAGPETCLRAHSSLICVKVPDNMGGGQMHCDKESATAIRNGTVPPALRTRIKRIRLKVRECIEIVRQCIPHVSDILDRVVDGFDAPNTEYRAFCGKDIIVVNMCTLLKGSSFQMQPTNLKYDTIVTLTHEIAHWLNANGGHGPEWRNSHMSLMRRITLKYTTFSAQV